MQMSSIGNLSLTPCFKIVFLRTFRKQNPKGKLKKLLPWNRFVPWYLTNHLIISNPLCTHRLVPLSFTFPVSKESGEVARILGKGKGQFK